jgi:hypothetical protein
MKNYRPVSGDGLAPAVLNHDFKSGFTTPGNKAPATAVPFSPHARSVTIHLNSSRRADEAHLCSQPVDRQCLLNIPANVCWPVQSRRSKTETSLRKMLTSQPKLRQHPYLPTTYTNFSLRNQSSRKIEKPALGREDCFLAKPRKIPSVVPWLISAPLEILGPLSTTYKEFG